MAAASLDRTKAFRLHPSAVPHHMSFGTQLLC